MSKNESLKSLKIIILLESLELGGAERQAVLLAHTLQKNHGANVEVWGLAEQNTFHSPENRLVPFCEELGVTWRSIELPMPSDWLEWIDWLPKFQQLLGNEKPNVILPYYTTNITAGILWRRVGARTCIWGQRDEGRHRPPRFIEALAVANTPWFISNSQDGLSFLRSTLKIDSGRLAQIRNGVMVSDPLEDRVKWRTRLEIKEDQVLVVMVANLHRFKDHRTLINSWHLINQSIPHNFRAPILALAGYPYDTANELKEQAVSLDLSDSIFFLGHVADVSGLLAAADICVHSSRCEGIPNGILEAMAMGLPVVATDIPGIREALGADAIEWLAAPNDAYGLAERISRLLLNIDLRRKVGACNRERVFAEFGIERLGIETANLILLTAKHSRPWSLLGWLLAIPGLLSAGLLAWQATHLLKKYSNEFSRQLRRGLSKTPILWRIIK